jgi:hypothetical protein
MFILYDCSLDVSRSFVGLIGREILDDVVGICYFAPAEAKLGMKYDSATGGIINEPEGEDGERDAYLMQPGDSTLITYFAFSSCSLKAQSGRRYSAGQRRHISTLAILARVTHGKAKSNQLPRKNPFKSHAPLSELID